MISELASALKEELLRSSFFKSFSAFSGQLASRLALIVAVARVPKDFIFKKSGNVQNQLSKHILKLSCFGIPSHKCKKTFSHEESALLALLFSRIQKKKIIHKARLSYSCKHFEFPFFGLLRLYWRIPLDFVFLVLFVCLSTVLLLAQFLCN